MELGIQASRSEKADSQRSAGRLSPDARAERDGRERQTEQKTSPAHRPMGGSQQVVRVLGGAAALV
jgi:hypothetical protein